MAAYLGWNNLEKPYYKSTNDSNQQNVTSMIPQQPQPVSNQQMMTNQVQPAQFNPPFQYYKDDNEDLKKQIDQLYSKMNDRDQVYQNLLSHLIVNKKKEPDVVTIAAITGFGSVLLVILIIVIVLVSRK